MEAAPAVLENRGTKRACPFPLSDFDDPVFHRKNLDGEIVEANFFGGFTYGHIKWLMSFQQPHNELIPGFCSAATYERLSADNRECARAIDLWFVNRLSNYFQQDSQGPCLPVELALKISGYCHWIMSTDPLLTKSYCQEHCAFKTKFRPSFSWEHAGLCRIASAKLLCETCAEDRDRMTSAWVAEHTYAIDKPCYFCAVYKESKRAFIPVTE